MTESEKKKIVLARVDEPGPVAVDVITADCGCKCWIGQAALDVVDDPNEVTETTCMPCAGITYADLADLARQSQLGALPGAREEIASVLGKAETDSFFRRYNVQEL